MEEYLSPLWSAPTRPETLRRCLVLAACLPAWRGSAAVSRNPPDPAAARPSPPRHPAVLPTSLRCCGRSGWPPVPVNLEFVSGSFSARTLATGPTVAALVCRPLARALLPRCRRRSFQARSGTAAGPVAGLSGPSARPLSWRSRLVVIRLGNSRLQPMPASPRCAPRALPCRGIRSHTPSSRALKPPVTPERAVVAWRAMRYEEVMTHHAASRTTGSDRIRGHVNPSNRFEGVSSGDWRSLTARARSTWPFNHAGR